MLDISHTDFGQLRRSPRLTTSCTSFETVEQLITSGSLKHSEVGILAFEASRVLHNSEVEKYLAWLDGEYKRVGQPIPAFGLARALVGRFR